MRTSPSTLLRSQVQGRILATLLLNNDREFSLGELAEKSGCSIQAAHTEVNRLVGSGLACDRRLGTSRMVRADAASPLTRPLTELMALTYGPVPVLTRELSGLAGIEEAHIYGSWAARYSGEAGHVPHDIDVLVIGNPDLDELDEAIRRAESSLLREVNVTRIRHETWAEQGDPLVRTIRSRPLIRLDIGDDDSAQEEQK